MSIQSAKKTVIAFMSVCSAVLLTCSVSGAMIDAGESTKDFGVTYSNAVGAYTGLNVDGTMVRIGFSGGPTFYHAYLGWDLSSLDIRSDWVRSAKVQLRYYQGTQTIEFGSYAITEPDWTESEIIAYSDNVPVGGDGVFDLIEDELPAYSGRYATALTSGTGSSDVLELEVDPQALRAALDNGTDFSVRISRSGGGFSNIDAYMNSGAANLNPQLLIAIPEPSTIVCFLGFGLVVMGTRRRRRDR